jgi:hypothetical protein
MIRGIGPVYARKMVRGFGEKVFEIIEATRIGCARWTAFRFYALVLLCHNFWCCIVRWQQGHRGRVCANVMAILTLSVAMELRTWRSGRIGRSTGSVTVG